MKRTTRLYAKTCPLAAVLAAMLASCSMKGMIRDKAAQDFPCPAEQIHVQGLGAATLRAIGCGRWADYRCGPKGYCYRLDEAAGPAPTPAEWAQAHALGAGGE